MRTEEKKRKKMMQAFEGAFAVLYQRLAVVVGLQRQGRNAKRRQSVFWNGDFTGPVPKIQAIKEPLR
jgi:hypothetical protein